jgi:large subunit ribosomal protein L10
MPALIFTKENPFKLYSQLEKNKTSAPAKAGQVAPKDIHVKAGPTTFTPGPIIGQLGKYGIKTGVEGGKLAIKADAVAAKKGKVIDAELAGILARLGVEPMEIGLNLTACYEGGFIFTSDVLYVDEKAYSQKFVSAYNESLNLAVYSGYPTTESLKIMIGKVGRESKAVSMASGFMTSDTANDILAKAFAEMRSISNSLPDEALSAELIAGKSTPVANVASEAPKAEKKEEKKEDASAGLGSLFG